MDAEVTTVPVRRALPTRKIERGGGRVNPVKSCNRWPKWRHPVNGSKA